MSFEIRLTGSHKGPSVTKKVLNPFTRKDMVVEPWFATADDTLSAHAVLTRAGAREVAPRKHLLALVDGRAVLVTSAGPLDGSEHAWRVKFDTSLQELTSAALQFLFDLCSAGSFVIDGADVAIATASSVKPRFPDAVVVGSPSELGVLMKSGFEAWQASRGALQ